MFELFIFKTITGGGHIGATHVWKESTEGCVCLMAAARNVIDNCRVYTYIAYGVRLYSTALGAVTSHTAEHLMGETEIGGPCNTTVRCQVVVMAARSLTKAPRPAISVFLLRFNRRLQYTAIKKVLQCIIQAIRHIIGIVMSEKYYVIYPTQ